MSRTGGDRRGSSNLGSSNNTTNASSSVNRAPTRQPSNPTTSYAGASRGGAATASMTSTTLKPSPSSPNPYAPAFVSAAGGSTTSSPWSTPGSSAPPSASSASTASRFKRGGGTIGNAARNLFGEKDTASKVWDTDASSDADDTNSLLRNNHLDVPESWESYDAGQSTSGGGSSQLNVPTPTNDASLSPSSTPDLGPYRGDIAGGIAPGTAEKLLLDERGTDLSLSLIKKDNPNSEISIHMLSLLYDPPVAGCELKPYVSIVDPNGRVTAVVSDESASLLDFRWFRGQKRLCSNSNGTCSVSGVPKAATMQCVSCAKMGASIPQHLTYFCSEKCLKENWQQHKSLHVHTTSQKREQHEWSYDEDSPHAFASSSSASLYCDFPPLLQNSWQETSSERSYTPQAEDVGRALRLECAPILKAIQAKKDALENGEQTITSTSQLTADINLGTIIRIDTGAVLPTPLPPPPRTILYTDPSTPINTPNTFRTVCYNVLAQIYATTNAHPYTPIWALSWDYRKNLLLREILSHHADIICLQEVQSNHFDAFFQPQLSKHGYDGIFKRKTRDAGSDASGAQLIDGCATFYKRERFALMEQYGISYNEAARQHTTNRTQLKRLLRGNIALVLVLEELTPPTGAANASTTRRARKRRLCITNTHIFWDPEYPDVKLWQTWVLCQELEKLVLPRNLPLVMCGDLNSLVESSVYELLSTERVEQGDDVFGATGDPSGLLPAPHQVVHRLPLLSAYATIGEPKYTNFTGSFVGVLDYVFFTRTHLRCVSCLDVDDEALLRKHTALPSPHYPSDHLPLVTTLEFLDA